MMKPVTRSVSHLDFKEVLFFFNERSKFFLKFLLSHFDTENSISAKSGIILLKTLQSLKTEHSPVITYNTSKYRRDLVV